MDTSKAIKTKDYHIETLRGIAILLVVAGHVIGSAPDGGMKIDFPSPWRYLYLWIDYIQMPLFTAIAGWVYALRPPQKKDFSSFISKKVLRLILPMITVGTIYFLMQYIIPGTNNKGNLSEIWRIYIFPYTIYWYLPSLFLIFLVTACVDINKWINNFFSWFIFFILAYILMAMRDIIIPESIPNLLSFKGAISQMPYFITGIGICRFSNYLYTKDYRIIYSIFAIIGLTFLQFEWFYSLYEYKWYESLPPFMVICTLILIFHFIYTNKFFIWIGHYAYTIYLFHVFGTSGGRIILKQIGIDNNIPIFIFSFILAVILPIIVELILSKWKITRILFLGKR